VVYLVFTNTVFYQIVLEYFHINIINVSGHQMQHGARESVAIAPGQHLDR